MLIGNIVCIFAPNVNTLILGGFIQGGGARACACLWRSVFRDIFVGEKLSIYGGYLSIFITFIVPAAPLLGGFLQHYFHWQSVFVFMLLYTLVSLTCIVFFF
ncbi:MAG: MFS transporter [Proteobacteria bacterium]|jgi:DHA1 family bicyclomycin/chloramphenicol resistance-like MFS transporter/DHA1 family 2-module integral membrane pump EmrD-like MFS transporter|nr:MFS transporter [Pseudomonadota bacterium]